MADIDKITSRPNEYLAETGVPQLMGGAIFFLLGSSGLVEQVLPKGFIAQEILKWIAICCCCGVLLGTRALKQRIVFPRGGYVELWPRPSVKVAIVAFVAGLAVIAITPLGWLGHQPHMESRFEEPGFAIVAAIMCLVSGWKTKNTSMMGFGVYLAVIAPLLWIPEHERERSAWLEVGVGAPLAVAGAIRLRRFLKANPRPMDTTNE